MTLPGDNTTKFAGNLEVEGDLTVGGDIALTDDLVMDELTTTGDVNVGADLAVAGNAFWDAVFTVNAEATNVIKVDVQINDIDGVAVATPRSFFMYLADDAAGLVPSTVAPTGGVAINTDGALMTQVTNLSWEAVTEADGDLSIDITDTGTPTFYLVIRKPDGTLDISGAITFA